MAKKIEVTLRLDPGTTRHKAAVVLLKEIEKLEREHNELDAKLAAVNVLACEINNVDHSDTRIERIRKLLAAGGSTPDPADTSLRCDFVYRARRCAKDSGHLGDHFVPDSEDASDGPGWAVTRVPADTCDVPEVHQDDPGGPVDVVPCDRDLPSPVHNQPAPAADTCADCGQAVSRKHYCAGGSSTPATPLPADTSVFCRNEVGRVEGTVCGQLREYVTHQAGPHYDHAFWTGPSAGHDFTYVGMNGDGTAFISCCALCGQREDHPVHNQQGDDK